MYCVVKRKAKTAACKALSDGTMLLDNYDGDKVRVVAHKAFDYIGLHYERDELKGMVFTIKQGYLARGWKAASKFVKDYTYMK